MLFDENDSDDNEISFKTENAYAKQYDSWREKEELHKLEQKYGDKDLASDAEDSDSEDESDEPPEVTEETEKQFLKTLALLKNKDPRIYNPNYKFFDNIQQENVKEEPTDDTKSSPNTKISSLAAAFADSDNDSDDGEIFKVEKKAPEPQAKEDTLKAYLTGKRDDVAEAEDLAPLKALWSDPALQEGEAFLRDYILDKKYLEVEEEEPADKVLDSEALEEDEARVEEQGQFERAYNFRFEEPDQEYLKRYPRTVAATRPADDRRSRKRAEVRARKEAELAAKVAERARLRDLRLRRVREKLATLREVTGNNNLAFQDEDVEGDFDPEEHDRRMKDLFDEQYYGEADAEKPVFPDLDEELEIENWEKYELEQDKDDVGNEDAYNEEDAPHCEHEDFNMDADYDPKKARTDLLAEIKETLGTGRRNRKRKSKLAQVLAAEKPRYVPEEYRKTYDQYMQEYYAMDCEDIIAGDLPTRFKYREVVPNSFGLTVEEILLADDKELNSWASLKKTVKYRPHHIEKGEVTTYQQKAQDTKLKRKLLPSLFKHIPEEPELVVRPNDNMKKKNNTESTEENNEDSIKHSTAPTEIDGDNDTPTVEGNGENPKKKKKKKNKKKRESTAIDDLSLRDQETNEISQNKDGNLVPEGEKVELNEANPNVTATGQNLNKKRRKKNKKNKQNGFIVEDIEPNVGVLTKEYSYVNGKSENKKLDAFNKNLNNKSKGKRKLHIDDNVVELEGPTSKMKKYNPEALNKDTRHKTEKKMKYKNKQFKKKPQTDKNENPLGKLSDERLKAYGLNPKKYRSFLKYKKF